MHVVGLAFRDQGLSENTQSLGLRQGRVDALVRDQGNDEVAKRCFAVGAFATQVVEFLTVTHVWY